MLKSFVKNHKFITVCTVGLSAGGLSLIDNDRRLRANDFMERTKRSTYFLSTAAFLLGDYWWSFRKLERGMPEYKEKQHIVNQRCAERLFKMCNHMGGYCAKFGQMASTMKDGIPAEYVEVLSKCQDNLTPVPFSELVRVVKEDLGVPPSSIFSEVEETPIGCASLAQVHRGILISGETVAIKVQYPNVVANTKIDLRNMELVCRVAEKIFPSYEYSWLVPKLRKSVESEFDFSKEIENQQVCRDFFATTPSVYVPRLYRPLCSKRLVVMEFIEGVKVNDIDGIKAMNINPYDVATLVLNAFSEMIFRMDRLHIDPHPGNMLVRHIPGTTNPQLVILDHGLYVKFHDGFNDDFCHLWLAMISQDKQAVREAAKPWGLEQSAEMLTFMLTGRRTEWKNKRGEAISKEKMKERMEQRMEEMEEKMKTMTPEQEKKFEEISHRMNEFMKNIPIEIMAVMRTLLMMSGLIKSLGGSDVERLDAFTNSAVRAQYRGMDNTVNYFSMLRWKVYLCILKIKLFVNDVMIDWYYRWYLHQDQDFHMNMDDLV